MAALDRLMETDAPARLRSHDTELFSDDPAVRQKVSGRLGWTHLAEQSGTVIEAVRDLASGAFSEALNDIVLLGMGGSSLASLVIGEVLGASSARLHVLDTVSPITVTEKLETLEPASTLYVVASKSGGTIEPNALYQVFRARADASLGREAAGRRFIAITDPGTSLQELAEREGFRATLSAPSTVGGRFSALSVFGLATGALIGADVPRMLERGRTMEAECGATTPANPAAVLAAYMIDAASDGADKLTIVASPELRSVGLWIEQLVAESLGKHGKGIVPVVELAEGQPSGLGADRAVVVIRYANDRDLERWTRERQTADGHMTEIVLNEPADLGAEFVRWEYAVALAGVLLGVNPFDEPNVAEAKEATTAVLADKSAIAATPDERPVADTVAELLGSVNEGDYLAILAYLPYDEAILEPLTQAVPRLAEQTGRAVCLELGPRYLHSTGQLHKGGPNTGVFLVITTRDATDVNVPGQSWTLRDLHRAQALGDLRTLAAHDRRVQWIDLPDATVESIAQLAEALLQPVASK